MTNQEIKLAAAGAGVRMWQIADELGIRDCNLSRKMRHELPEAEKAQLMEIIRRLAKGGTAHAETARAE